MNNQIYYLISQDYYSTDFLDETQCNKSNVLSCIKNKNTEIVEIDIEDIDNLFEVIKEKDNVYKIINIHKHKVCGGKFEVGDIIYEDFGMISFYTKNPQGNIDKIAIYPTIICKKEEIILYNSDVELEE